MQRSKPRALPKANSKSLHDPNKAKEHEQGTDQRENRNQPVSGDVEEIAHASVFSIDEYARLCVILCDHPDCREALINSGKEMTPAALDAKLRRDYFWTTTVEKGFNDESYRPRTPELLVFVDGVQADNCPPCYRPGDRLKEWFRKLRSDFTTRYDSWKGSEQNDPDRLIDFLPQFQGRPTTKS